MDRIFCNACKVGNAANRAFPYRCSSMRFDRGLRTWLRALSVLTSLVVSAAPVAAFGQASTGGDQGASAPQAEQTAQGNAQLGEITVTATKTQQSTLDVPIAVTEIPAVRLQEYNIQTAADYEITVPNLSFEVSAFGTAINEVIRGVSGDNVTADYIDDTPAPPGLDPKMFDLASIEVLKGPQGTLYGEASMGGNIKYVTEKPSLTGDTTGQMMFQVGETAMGDSPDYGLTGSVNFVLIPDRVALRLSGIYQHDSGWTKDTDPAIPDDPAYVGFVQAQGWGPPGFMVNELGPNLPRVYVDKGDRDSVGATGSLRVAITDSFESTTGLIYQNITMPNGPNNALGPPTNGYEPTSYVEAAPVYTPQFTQSLFDMVYEDLTYKGEGFTLTSSTSYTFYWTNLTDDGNDGMFQYEHAYYGWNPNLSDLQPFTLTTITGNRQWTEEVRLAFDRVPLVDGLSGVVGLFDTYAWSGFCGGAPLGGSGNTNQCIPVEDPGLAAQGIWPTDMEWEDGNWAYSDQKAIFGEFYYKPINPLTITLGLRYYWDYNDTQQWQGTGIDNNPSSACVPNGGTLIPPFTAAGGFCDLAHQTSRGSGLIPKYAVSYKPTDNQELYASRSQGFRLGGPAPQFFSYCAKDLASIGQSVPVQFTRPLKSDDLVSWEAGYKGTYFNQQLFLSTDAFEINWNNKQQVVAIPICDASGEVNLGAARIVGGEFELTGKPIEGFPLDVHLAIGLAHNYITNSGSAASIVGAAPVGSELLDTPEWTGTVGVDYNFNLMTHQGFANLSYSHTGEKESTTWTLQDPVVIPGYGILNGRLGVRFGSSNQHEVSLNANNILNVKASLGDYNNGAYTSSEVINGKVVTDPVVIVQPPISVLLQYRTKF